jgi:hypothetical protein
MKLSVFHISHLHRDPTNPICNNVLPNSLEKVRRNYSTEETPAVRSPDLIIVSGDIIQDIRPDRQNAEARLCEQY